MSPAATTAGAARPHWLRRHNRKGLVYVLPAMIVFAVMIGYPVLRSFYLSFFDYTLLDPDAATFVGLRNYARLFTRAQDYLAFWHTLYFTLLYVPLAAGLALPVAILLNELRRGSTIVRTLIFTPVVVSLAVSAVMFSLLYNPTFGLVHHLIVQAVGVLNAASRWLGGSDVTMAPVNGVLGDARWAMPAVVLMSLWNGFGFNVILYLVGLQRIPDDLYEAAAIDGAGGWRTFWHITLPQLRPTLYLVVLLGLIGALKVFGQPFILTSGGPHDATQTLVMRLYSLAFLYGKFQLGYASALAYALACFIFLMSLMLRRYGQDTEL